ncbi:MAG: lytic transglycosylase domain-containing protein [Sporomusaceae bacterium]|jgi:soluble lytic murein transglycosylase-like protein|nr:lytic transglycosylase domain-containing protein [Sporomusaceae bacterium]
MKRIFFIFLLTLFCCVSASTADASSISDKYYKVIYKDITRTNPSLGTKWADWTAKTIIYYSVKWRVNPFLAAANFKQESCYSMRAYSSVGAIGIAQLMPNTAKDLGVNPHGPSQNIEGGIRYLAQSMNIFRYAGKWQTSYAIAAYNAGPGAIEQYGGIPPFPETRKHVEMVGKNYNLLCREFAQTQ